MASSRSTMTRSAAVAAALAKRSGWLAGTNNNVRATAAGPGASGEFSAVMSGGHRSTLDELPGDDVALDLVRALADDHQRCVAEVALDVELRGVAVSTVDAHRVQGNLHGDLRGKQLRHPGFHVGALTGVELPCSEPGQLSSRGELGDHLGQV